MKQQGCAALDADVAQAEEQRAVRLAMALDAKQLAARIGAVDLRLEILDPSALAISFRRGGERGGRRYYHQQHTDEAGEISHGASFFEIFRQRFTRKAWNRPCALSKPQSRAFLGLLGLDLAVARRRMRMQRREKTAGGGGPLRHRPGERLGGGLRRPCGGG